MMNDSPSVEEVEWKKTVVRLDNRLKVDKSTLKQIVIKADFQENCRLLLILDRENGFPRTRGVAFPMVDMNYVAPACGDNNAYDRKCIGDYNIKAWREWDYAIYLPEITAKKCKDFEPYFAFIMGHELEHVRIMQLNLELHRFASWVGDNLKKFATKAGIELAMRTYEFPIDLYCNKKGKKLAVEMYGEEFTNKLTSLVSLESENHKEVLQFILSSECNLKDDDRVETLANQIVQKIDDNELRNVIRNFWECEKEKQYNFAREVNLPLFLGLVATI